jgi:ABC-type Fe3+ transport system permease subunit
MSVVHHGLRFARATALATTRNVACLLLPVARAVRSRRSSARNPQRATRTRTADWQRATGTAVLALLVILIAAPASACAVCYGAPGDPLVKGANNGIMFLLAIVGGVQIGFVAMFWSFWKRSRQQRRFKESLRVIEGGPRS